MKGPVVFAIDPGPKESGWCVLSGHRVAASGVAKNGDLLERVKALDWIDELAIEMISSYGMPVGAEVFETCVWIGRFIQAWDGPSEPVKVYRRDVKLHLCGTPRAKDANVRQALIDLIGPQGTKKQPGPTHGVKSHAWAALGVAVTAAGITPESIRGAAA